jgi:MFS family permease
MNYKKKNKSFILFLIGQGISNLADAFHFIAVTLLLISVTGSGTYASFAVISTPIASFLFSPFAGSLGDKFNEKYLLMIICFLRSITALLFKSNSSIWDIYALMIILSILEILYSPSKKKIIINLIDSKEVMIGNSILSGIAGFMFIIGPIAAGIIIELTGVMTIFKINSILYFLSGISIIFIKTYSKNQNKSNRQIGFKPSIYLDMRKGFRYFKSKPLLKELIFISTITSLAIASINIAFYSFAFDTLGVTSKRWGIMMSVFYGTSLFAMLISIYFNKIIQKMDYLFIYLSIIIISITWFLYSMSENIIIIMGLQFIEGIFISLLTIVLSTKVQIITHRNFTARIMAINDIFSNIGKLAAAIFTYTFLRIQSVKMVFIFNFAVLFLYGIYKLFSILIKD